MRFKKHGPLEARRHCEHGGVEALEMAGLNNSANTFSARDQVVGFGEICGQGFFDEQVDAGIEEICGDGIMMNGWNGDAGGVEIEVRSEEFADRVKNRDLVLCSGFMGAGRIGFDGGNESYGLTGRFKFAIDAEVIAAKCARAGNGNAQLASAGYFATSFSGSLSPASPCTALRQRP
ncbi:MAG TPA: hypothetical protein VME23_01480 [Terracidiphilus sp.]|nr:hypothetical protein [Terracidiphilus sp.]